MPLPIIHALRRGAVLWGTAILAAGSVWAEDGTPFSHTILVDRMRAAAAEPYAPPDRIDIAEGGLDYDEYRMIQFDRDRARPVSEDPMRVVQAYHPGWLFEHAVRLNTVTDGIATPIEFGREDFIYQNDLGDRIDPDTPFSGIAGFRLNAHLNDPDRLDEVVSFLGASYFRALGRGNVYGLSARGLAINTFGAGDEEFPVFTEFWIENGVGDGDRTVIHAALDSPSVTGAYRFALAPGDTTVMDVTLTLFFRDDVGQLGIAPLTSMFLFGPSDPGAFQDFRTRVHDSEALLMVSDDRTFLRPLSNPPALANSYIGIANPTGFGLIQRTRDFDAYLDSHASYQSRPSLMVEPVGDWGSGVVRLIEIPTDFETNDNVVAFWVPQSDISAGDTLSFAYRLHWGAAPPHPDPQTARILRTLVGFGGVAGNPPIEDRRKYVIDFDGTSLPDADSDMVIEPVVTVSDGTIAEMQLERLHDLDLWRLVIEFAPGDRPVSELSATLMAGDRRMSETWLYQWQTE